jgi:hypothetical protein
MTVKNLVINSLVDNVTEDNYRICLNEDCDVVYFDLEKNVLFGTKKVLILNIFAIVIELQKNKLLMQFLIMEQKI